MAFKVKTSELADLDYDLVAEVARHQAALEEHASSVDQPAPIAHALVDHIVRSHDGQIEIEDDRPVALGLGEVKAMLGGMVDAAAEAERGKWITLGPGQAMVYALKQAEVVRWQAAGEPGGNLDPNEFPLAHERADRHGTTIPHVLRQWRDRNAGWEHAAVAIERARESAKERIAKARNPDEAQRIFDEIEWPAS